MASNSECHSNGEWRGNQSSQFTNVPKDEVQNANVNVNRTIITNHTSTTDIHCFCISLRPALWKDIPRLWTKGTGDCKPFSLSFSARKILEWIISPIYIATTTSGECPVRNLAHRRSLSVLLSGTQGVILLETAVWIAGWIPCKISITIWDR